MLNIIMNVKNKYRHNIYILKIRRILWQSTIQKIKETLLIK